MLVCFGRGSNNLIRGWVIKPNTCKIPPRKTIETSEYLNRDEQKNHMTAGAKKERSERSKASYHSAEEDNSYGACDHDGIIPQMSMARASELQANNMS